MYYNNEMKSFLFSYECFLDVGNLAPNGSDELVSMCEIN